MNVHAIIVVHRLHVNPILINIYVDMIRNHRKNLVNVVNMHAQNVLNYCFEIKLN